MSGFVANARMYAVAPAAEEAWRALLAHACAEAGLALAYMPYPAPQPLEELWARPDLGAVFMCGYPIALGLAEVVPLVAPIPDAPWAGGRAVYRSDLIVHRDCPWRSLEDGFGGHAGWTVGHSHSGFNAFRHHLLPHRSAARPRLFARTTGGLVTARRILDAVAADDWHVYWLSNGQLLRLPVEAVTLAQVPQPEVVYAGSGTFDSLSALALDGTHAYFATSGGREVMRVEK